MLSGFHVSCAFEDLLVGHRGNLSSRSRSTENLAKLAILYEQRPTMIGPALHIDQSKIQKFRNTVSLCI